jgi:hypothetical protein
MNLFDKLLFNTAYTIRRYTKSSCIIKLSIVLLFVALCITIVTQNLWWVTMTLVFNQLVTHVLEYLYAFQEENEG